MHREIIILLKNGFEEIEALAPLDVLRRLNYPVKLISMEESKTVISSHGITFVADEIYSDDLLDTAGVILPGGMPGSLNLKNDARVISLVKKFFNEKKLVAAICAAPIVLGEADILSGLNATSYPGFEADLKCLNYLEDKVVISQNVITSRGPATAFDFAFAIAEYLGLSTSVLLKGMLFK